MGDGETSGQAAPSPLGMTHMEGRWVESFNWCFTPGQLVLYLLLNVPATC